MQREDFSVEQIVGEFAVRWGFRPRQAWRHGRGMTQDEVAAEYNALIGDPQAPMSGKRISDFEAWPVGGVKPTLHTLSVLAQLYGTQPHLLVDFADYEAMTRTERAALRVHDHRTEGGVPAVSTVAIASPTADIASDCAAYVKCCLAIIECGTYYREEIDELLAVLNRVVATLVCPDAAWLDVVVPVHSDVPTAAVPLVEGLVSEHGWLQVWASGVRRTTRPTLIPIQVNGTPWRGSGNAFLSRGIDYVGSFRGLYTASEYDLAPEVASEIEARYDYWRDECYFGALLAAAIRSPEPGASDIIGVLNLNFRFENPIGDGDTLEPQRSVAILDVLEPALRLIGTAIQMHHQLRDGT
ncbi:helix-turn-helix transcriptional regulator [Nocardia sp. NBC_00565]|uniref:helix-turn-helix domain-containing protein n=1 Tax=Nocardia sp. NBC_00565 TaxID=2975993 RepID=UPI002E7FCF61|nr:helix-turn-helix transcriptional regulator [Nocardia sp. NBC_00565]WUC07466.1 helix-turn-helix transcriptional regulator [Nocardia sp. NBC_00565]